MLADHLCYTCLLKKQEEEKANNEGKKKEQKDRRHVRGRQLGKLNHLESAIRTQSTVLSVVVCMSKMKQVNRWLIQVLQVEPL